MKTSFYILPERVDNEPLHLLVEAGDNGISFTWYSKGPDIIKGIVVYDFSDKIIAAEMAAEVENIFHTNTIFKESYTSINICYDFKESLLVPEAYYLHATAESMLNMVFATDEDCTINTEPIKSRQIVNMYAVNNKLRAAITKQFPLASVHHTSSLQLQMDTTDTIQLIGIFFHNRLKIILFKDDLVQMVNQFHYNTPVDAAYHLLNCCSQYNINPVELKLILSGMIDEKSKLYEEIYKYFLNIKLNEPGAGIELHERIKLYPAHFFSHLTWLISCVS